MISTVLVIGASSYLAQRLVPLAADRAHVIGTARNAKRVHQPAEAVALDLARDADVLSLIKSLRPDAIIHLAACNPGGANADFEAVNHHGASAVARAAATTNARLVAVSTDIVHNGREAPYADDAASHPINDYGASKARGELAISRIYPDAAIVRTSLIYDTRVPDRGTTGFISRLQSGQTLQLFTNVIRQPIWADSLANGLISLAMDAVTESGRINLAGDQAISRAEFALKLLRFWSVNPDAGSIEFVELDHTISSMPLDCRLQTIRARHLGFSMPGVDAVLSAAAV